MLTAQWELEAVHLQVCSSRPKMSNYVHQLPTLQELVWAMVETQQIVIAYYFAFSLCMLSLGLPRL